MAYEKKPTAESALKFLADHNDPCVREACKIICETNTRRKRILDLVKDALSQLRLDMKYLVFDLECTRRERDEAIGGEV